MSLRERENDKQVMITLWRDEERTDNEFDLFGEEEDFIRNDGWIWQIFQDYQERWT